MAVESATSDEAIRECFPVMAQLRPHLAEGEFVERVRRQERDGGYRLAFVRDAAGGVVAVAGYRVSECLAWGRFLYVDDLVTATEARSCGHGEELLAWLLDTARREGCEQFHLDSGVHRDAAHRFYFRHRMIVSSFHFSMDV